LRVDVAALEMIQSSKPEPWIMRYELSDYEWTAIKPMLPKSHEGTSHVWPEMKEAANLGRPA
jgi:hypothetical protein